MQISGVRQNVISELFVGMRVYQAPLYCKLLQILSCHLQYDFSLFGECKTLEY
jgi:hypothetical protein